MTQAVKTSSESKRPSTLQHLDREAEEDWIAAWLEYEGENRKKMLARWKMFGFDSLSRDRSIIDIGAGCGDFLQMLKDAGFTRFIRGIVRKEMPVQKRKAVEQCVDQKRSQVVADRIARRLLL